MGKPDEETEARALAQADYQTRLRVERANMHRNPSSIDPSMVDKSHKGSIKPNKSGKFDSDFISPNAVREEFDLINANKDYMDSNIAGNNELDDDSIPEMDMFFQQ